MTDWISIHNESARVVDAAAEVATNYGNDELATELWLFAGDLRVRAQAAEERQ